jgi:hypothetical protein
MTLQRWKIFKYIRGPRRFKKTIMLGSWCYLHGASDLEHLAFDESEHEAIEE